jgi:hypothetical protein
MSRRRIRRPSPTTDQRSPEERLEALVREPNPDRAHRMMRRIRGDLERNPQPGPWITAARTLSERLIISEDAFYYFADMFLESIMMHASRSDPELGRLMNEIDAIERAHGLTENEAWHVNEGPPDWRALNDAWDRRADDIMVAALRENGDVDLATLREQNPDEFEARASRGYRDVWGEDEA